MKASSLGDFINKTLIFRIRNVEIAPTYWQAGIILILLFTLVWTIARIRNLYVHWSLGKSAMSMIFWGFLLALIVEGFLWIGGKTLLTEILGWKNAPKPISTTLDIGRSKLVKVLDGQERTPMTLAEQAPTNESVYTDYLSLPDAQAEKVRSLICAP